MKQTLLLMVLVLGMCSINVSAQQPIRNDTNQKIHKREQTKTVETLDTTKVIKCFKCNGQGTILEEVINGFTMPKEKKKCSICGSEYWDNIHHFHVECKECRGKGYLRKGSY